MLPKSRRIPRKDFSLVYKKTRRFDSPHLLLSVIPMEGVSRFSFSVSKKIAKRAVDRNKLRRRGYRIVGMHLKELKDGFRCFFSFKKRNETMNFTDLEKEIMRLLSLAFMLR